jgi:hypothetical protein
MQSINYPIGVEAKNMYFVNSEASEAQTKPRSSINIMINGPRKSQASPK